LIRHQPGMPRAGFVSWPINLNSFCAFAKQNHTEEPLVQYVEFIEKYRN